MKKLFLSLIFVLIFVVIVFVQNFFDTGKANAQYSEPVVLDSEFVKIFDLGLHNAAGDLMWLAAIQYFGGGESDTYEKLDDYLFLATDLDPKFSYPYAFGALILPTIGQTDQGLKLGQLGTDQKIEDYRIPYYTATTYHINKNDSKNAAKYFDIAANTPGVLESIKKVAARYGSQTDKRTQTKEIWTGIYETTKDEVVQERAKNHIVHLEILDLLEQLIEIYKNKYGSYPTDLEQLVEKNILKEIPANPFGLKYKIIEDGKVRAQ